MLAVSVARPWLGRPGRGGQAAGARAPAAFKDHFSSRLPRSAATRIDPDAGP